MSQKNKSQFVKKGNRWLFAPFNSKEEYKRDFQSINVKLDKHDRFEFLVFVERIRSTMLCGVEPISKTEREESDEHSNTR